MLIKNIDGSTIGTMSSLPHHPLWRVHLSVRTAAHDATATTAIAYTTTTITTTKLSPTRAISMSLASKRDPFEGRGEMSAATTGASLDNAGAGIVVAAAAAAVAPTAVVATAVTLARADASANPGIAERCQCLRI